MTTLTKRQARMLTQAAQRRPATVLMTEDEARQVVNSYRDSMARAEAHLTSARAMLLDLHDREGWRALGYTNWRECATAELGLSQAHVYRLLTAAEVERDIRPVLIDFSHDEKNLPETVLRPAAQLESAEERQTAARMAIEAANGNVPTAAQMQRAVDEIKPPTDDQVAQMRERFYALGYEQFYASDAGWTAYHPRTKKANYKTWPDVEADIARKESAAAPRVCSTCGGPWGRPGSMIVGGDQLCQDCAAARLSSGKPFAPATDAPVVRRCGRCNQPHRNLTTYGQGVLAEYPNGITLCHPCVVELIQIHKQPAETATSAAPVIEPATTAIIWCACGKEATNRATIGGILESRCDACAIRAERDDLAAQLGNQYKGIATDRDDDLDGRAHRIFWASGGGGDYMYAEALERLRERPRHTPPPYDPNAAARAWLVPMKQTLARCHESTMFRLSEMLAAVGHIEALLAAASPHTAIAAAAGDIATADEVTR